MARPTSDTITEIGAVKVRGGERIGELATLVDPGTGRAAAASSRSPASPPRWSRARRALAAVLPVAAGVPRGRGAGGAQRPVRRRVPARRVQAARAGRGRGRRCSARRGSPGRVLSPRRGAQRAAGRAGPAVRHRHHAQPPGARRRPGHRRGAAPAAGAGRQRRRAEPRRSCWRWRATRPRTGPPPHSGASARWPRPCRPRRASTCSAGRATRCSTSARAATCGAACAATSPPASGGARVRDMVALAERVDTVVCAHALEAAVRELRLIAGPPAPLQPPLPRTRTTPGGSRTTAEAFPRLSVVSHAAGGRGGPVPVAAGGASPPSRRCSTPCRLRRLHPAHPGARGAGPARARCTSWGAAPPRAPGCRRRPSTRPPSSPWPTCSRGRADDAPAAAARRRSTATPPASGSRRAARHRDRLAGLVLAPWAGRSGWRRSPAVDELVGARPDGRGGWEIAVVRHGRLAAAGVAARGVPPMPVIDALRAGAQVVLPGPGPLRGAPAEEVGLLHRWLDHRRHPARARRRRRGPSPPAAPRRGRGGRSAPGRSSVRRRAGRGGARDDDAARRAPRTTDGGARAPRHCGAEPVRSPPPPAARTRARTARVAA